jgi:hypothetical protein
MPAWAIARCLRHPAVMLPSATEIVSALELEDHLVGVTAKATGRPRQRWEQHSR